MANRIKGITLEINGSVTGLDKALKDTNASLSQTQKSLKDVDRLLKLDPKNTELLTQKQGYLKDAISATEEKLKKEKEALDQMKANNATGEVTEQQKALEREIVATEKSLEKLTDQFKELGKEAETPIKSTSEKLQNAGKKVEEVGGKISVASAKIGEAGEAMTKGVTVPIAAAGAASVAAWKEVDNGLDIVIKKTGATGKAAEDLKKRVTNLTSSIPTDFETAGSAVGEVNTRFGLTGQALEDLSGKFIKFADLNETDVSTSIDNTQKVLEAFNLDSKDAGTVLDLLNKTGQDTGISMDTLSTSLVSNAKSMRDMGFTVSDAAKFLGELETSGLDSSTVLAGLKKAVVNAAKEGKPMSEALKEVQTSIKNAGSSTEATQAAMELFGNKAGPAIAQAVQDGKLSFDELGTSLSDYAGNVETTFDETLDPLDKTKMAMNDLKVIGADIVETSAPMIEQALSMVRNVIRDLSEKWNGLTEEQQQFIIKIAGIAAVVGPVLIVVSKVGGAIGGIVTGIGNLITTMSGVSAAITAAGGIIPAISALLPVIAPFLIGGAIIVGIIAAAVLLIKNWDKVKESVGKVVQGVKDSWNGLVQSAKDLARDAKQAFESLKNGIKEKIDAAKEFVRKGFEKIKGFANFVWNLPSLGLDTITSIPDKIKGIVKKIKGFFNFTWNLPHIPLPHFAISPSGWKLSDLLQGSIPSLGIEWYEKAMNKVRILKKATIFGEAGGKLLGGGEAGREVVSGESTLLSMIKKAVASVLTTIRGNATSGIGDMVSSALGAVRATITYGDMNVTVYGSQGQDVKELADEVVDRIKNSYDRDGAVWA